MIDDLPWLAPDAARGARTTARCHHTLAARRRRSEARRQRAHPGAAIAERLLVAGACAIYLISMVANVARLIVPR